MAIHSRLRNWKLVSTGSRAAGRAARMWALAALALGAAAGCEPVADPEITPQAAVAEGTGGIGGRVSSTDGEPVPGASVRTPGGAATVTDAEGRFVLLGLAAAPRLAVTVEAVGYAPTTAVYEVRAGATLTRPITIQEAAAPVTLVAGTGGAVPLGGGGRVVFPPNAFAGVAAGEPVTVRATYIDPASPAQLATAPGDFTAVTFGGTLESLETFGMADVDVRDTRGNRLELASGQAAQIRFPARGGVSTAGLWDFDPQTGRWIEEGRVSLSPDSTTLNATVRTIRRGKNVDVPIQRVCIEVEVLNLAKLPRVNQFVTATGISYAGVTQGWTNNGGLVQLVVRASSLVSVAAGPASQVVNTPAPGTPGCPRVASLVF